MASDAMIEKICNTPLINITGEYIIEILNDTEKYPSTVDISDTDLLKITDFVFETLSKTDQSRYDTVSDLIEEALCEMNNPLVNLKGD